MTWARVKKIRAFRQTVAYKCPYCHQRHEPPLSYFYAVYAYLANW